MRIFNTKCENPECEGNNPNSWIRSATGQHPPYKTKHQLVDIADDHWVGICECGTQNRMPVPEYMHGKPRYPMYNASVDKTFGSYAEEKAYAKANKLEGLGSKERIRDLKY